MINQDDGVEKLCHKQIGPRESPSHSRGLIIFEPIIKVILLPTWYIMSKYTKYFLFDSLDRLILPVEKHSPTFRILRSKNFGANFVVF